MVMAGFISTLIKKSSTATRISGLERLLDDLKREVKSGVDNIGGVDKYLTSLKMIYSDNDPKLLDREWSSYQRRNQKDAEAKQQLTRHAEVTVTFAFLFFLVCSGRGREKEE